MKGKKRQERMLSVREAAERLGLSPWTVYSWVGTEKKLPSYKVGRRRLIALSDVERLLDGARNEVRR